MEAAPFYGRNALTRLLSFLLLVFSLLPTAPGLAGEIIVNRHVEQQAVSRSFARLIFTMRVLRWRDGKKIRVFVLPDRHPAHQEFSKRSLDLYPRQLRRVWDRHLFSGSGAVPTQVETVEEMLERVATTPGAVGYLPTGSGNDSVRIIDVRD
jgi:hypothetical protein